MAYVFMLAFFVVLGYIIWRVRAKVRARGFQSYQAPQGHPRMRWVSLAAVMLFILTGATAPKEDTSKPARAPAAAQVKTVDADNPATTTPAAQTTPATSPAVLAAAKKTADDDRRRKAAAAKRSAARAAARHTRYVANRKKANRAKAKAKNAARAAAKARAVAAAQAKQDQRDAAKAALAAPSSESSGRGSDGDYAGMTCPEIGHSFNVTPGSDMDHDADGDGVACESQ